MKKVRSKVKNLKMQNVLSEKQTTTEIFGRKLLHHHHLLPVSKLESHRVKIDCVVWWGCLTLIEIDCLLGWLFQPFWQNRQFTSFIYAALSEINPLAHRPEWLVTEKRLVLKWAVGWLTVKACFFTTGSEPELMCTTTPKHSKRVAVFLVNFGPSLNVLLLALLFESTLCFCVWLLELLLPSFALL